jgi:hypothetical protein
MPPKNDFVSSKLQLSNQLALECVSYQRLTTKTDPAILAAHTRAATHSG